MLNHRSSANKVNLPNYLLTHRMILDSYLTSGELFLILFSKLIEKSSIETSIYSSNFSSSCFRACLQQNLAVVCLVCYCLSSDWKCVHSHTDIHFIFVYYWVILLYIKSNKKLYKATQNTERHSNSNCINFIILFKV